MGILRNPHPWFSAAWLVWFGNVFAAVLMPQRPLYGLAVLLSFLPIEALAVATKTKGNARDTLSEIFTWVQRKVSPDTDFARGWNAMLLSLVLIIAFLLGRTIVHYSGFWPLGVTVAGLTIVWLYDHWWFPNRRG